MRFEQLEYLISVSESRSLNEASKRLYMSPQSLGKALTDLEKELGVELINRGHSGSFLTKDGFEVLDIAREIIERREALKNMHGTKSETTGCLIILCCPSVHRTVLPGIIEKFSQQMPFVDVVVVAKDSQLIPNEHLSFASSEKKSVVSIINVPKVNECLKESLKKAKLTFKPLTDDQWVVCINKRHPLASKANPTLHELLKERLVIEYPGYPQPGVDRTTLDYYDKYGTPSVKKIVDSENLMNLAIDKDEYIGFASSFYIEHTNSLDLYQNITVKNFTPAIKSSIGYAIRIKDYSDPRIHAFCNCLRESISSGNSAARQS